MAMRAPDLQTLLQTRAGDVARAIGKLFFLDALGIACVRAADHDDIYRSPGWSA